MQHLFRPADKAMEKLRAQTQQSHTEADRYVAFVSAKNCTSTQHRVYSHQPM